MPAPQKVRTIGCSRLGRTHGSTERAEPDPSLLLPLPYADAPRPRRVHWAWERHLVTGSEGEAIAWRRPYRRNPTQPLFWVFVPFMVVWLALCLPPFVSNLVEGDVASAVMMGLPTAWGVLMGLYAARLARAGIYTSSMGVQVRNIVRTHTLPWADIAGFTVEKDTKSALFKLDRACVVRRNGEVIASFFPNGPYQPGGDSPARAVEALEATMRSESPENP